MVGLSAAHLFSRLFVAAAVALLACCCCYCNVVSCAMVPSKQAPTPSVDLGRPFLGTEDRSKHHHHHQLSHAERESNSQFSSLIAIDKDQDFTETKESEMSEYSQRIRTDGVSTTDSALVDDAPTLPGKEEKDHPGRERVIRVPEPDLTDEVEVAEPGFLVKTVQSFKNVEGSGSAALPLGEDRTDDTLRVTPSSSAGDAQQTTTDGINCPECVKRKQNIEKLPPGKLREMRLEQIKMRILSKLKLEQAPNVSASLVDIPEPLARGRMVGDLNEVLSLDDQDTAEFPDEDRWEEEELENDIGHSYEESSQVIITAHEGSGACPRKTPSSGCFSIEISARVEENIVSAKLWFLLKDSAEEIYQNRTLVVSYISSGRHSRRSVLHTASVVYRADWQNVDLTRAVRHMVSHERRTYLFEVRCTTCSGTGSPVDMKPGRRPFLVLAKGTRRGPRAPRSIICPPNHTTCCKEIFYVSFAELKWDWIIEPKGYSANYCRGSCEDNVAQGYGHTYIMTTVKNLNVDRGLSIIPCCAPIKTKPLVLLYYDNEGYIYKKQLKNMITESCACM